MSTDQSSRRHVLAAAGTLGLTALASKRALAQPQGDIPFSKFVARDAGREHRARLTDISKTLNGKAPVSPDGMALLVDYLVSLKILAKDDADRLKKLIKTIFDATTFEGLISSVNQLSKEIGEKAGDLAAAIFSIARDSLAYAQSAASGLPLHAVIRVVATDVQGAIDGALTGEKLGGARGAILGAIAGAVAASANAL